MLMKTLHPLSVPTSPYFILQDSMIVSPVFVVHFILIVYVELRDKEICGMLPNETGRVSWKVGVRARNLPIPQWGRVAAQISAELIPQQIFPQNQISIPVFCLLFPVHSFYLIFYHQPQFILSSSSLK